MTSNYLGVTLTPGNASGIFALITKTGKPYDGCPQYVIPVSLPAQYAILAASIIALIIILIIVAYLKYKDSEYWDAY